MPAPLKAPATGLASDNYVTQNESRFTDHIDSTISQVAILMSLPGL